jgi:hypothetical protein
MDWNNTNHLLQAALVCCCALMFVFGFRSGDQT